MLLGSGFSPAFAEVILLTNAVILSIIVVAAFFDGIAGIFAKVLQHASAIRACLAARLGARHR